MDKMKTLAAFIFLLATVCPSSHGGEKSAGPNAEEQANAVKAIEAARGRLSSDADPGQKRIYTLRVSRGADIDAVMRAIGTLENLGVASFNEVPVTDDHLKALGGMPRLKTLKLIKLEKISEDGVKYIAANKNIGSLTIMDCKIGDGSMAAVGKLGDLQHLVLTGTLVTDKGLRELTELKKLEVFFVGPHIGDAGLAEIAKLKSLTTLVLRRSAVTGKGLKKLARLDKLVGLNLLDSSVGDDDLPALAELPNLGGLVLEGTKVTDAGMGHVAACKHVRWLELSHTQVSDVGILRLVGMRELKTLGCAGTKVTREGIKVFQGLRTDVAVSDQ